MMSNWMAAARLLLVAFALLAAGVPALAQQPRYEIHNESDQVVTFFTMDPARGTWKTQQLQPYETKNLVWYSGANQGKIRIGTEGRGHVQYDVQSGQKYAIVWSDRKGVWDVRSRGHLGDSGGGYAQGPGHAPPPAGYRGGPQHAVGYANGNGYQPSQPQLASWSLHNRSNERIQFQTFDPARGTWKNQVSYPHQTTPYTMSPGVMSGKIRIATTDRGYVEYDVQAGGSYSIIWNRHSGMWDVRTSRRDG